MHNSIDIKFIRKKANLSQKELAERLGIVNCTLDHYESGLRKITLEMFLKILEICHCDFKIEIRGK